MKRVMNATSKAHVSADRYGKKPMSTSPGTEGVCAPVVTVLLSSPFLRPLLPSQGQVTFCDVGANYFIPADGGREVCPPRSVPELNGWR